MATTVIMPRQGQSVESCILSKWHKAPGEAVHIGDMLFSYETDKASFDEEAKAEGVLLQRVYEEDDDVPCLVEVCRIGSPEEYEEYSVSGGAIKNATPLQKADSSKETGDSDSKLPESETARFTAGIAADTASTADYVEENNGRLAISPRARLLAEKTNVDPNMAISTGPNGRIIERDITQLLDAGVRMTATASTHAASKSLNRDSIIGTGLGGRITSENMKNYQATAETTLQDSIQVIGDNIVESVPGSFSASQTAKVASDSEALATASHKDIPAYQEVQLSTIRKVIAKTMMNSLATTCQLTLHTSFDATSILAIRAGYKEAGRPDVTGITLTDMVLFAVAKTLLTHQSLNAHMLEKSIRFFEHVHLGLAVDTERGLMVPTLFGADQMSLSQLSAAAKSAARECQTGSINPDKLKGGTFTVTNLGAFGIESFTPVLNAPQTGILGVNAIETKVKTGKNGLEGYPAMGLSLTFDHRALDGAPAARFLKDLCANLERFEVLLAL